MTEYKGGDEDLYLSVSPQENGMVLLAVHYMKNGEKIVGIMLPGEIARKTAQRLTLMSWQAEENV